MAMASVGLLVWQLSKAHPVCWAGRGCFGHNTTWGTHCLWPRPWAKGTSGETAHRLATVVSRAQPLCTNLLGPAAAHRALSSSFRLGKEPQAGLLASSVLLVPERGAWAEASLRSQSHHEKNHRTAMVEKEL